MLGRLIAIMMLLIAPSVVQAQSNQSDKLLLTGKSFEYQISDYKLCIHFTAENRLTWTYLSAPNGEAGKTADEILDRRYLRNDLVLLSWTEASGANITDIFDLGKMKLNATFVTPKGQRFVSDASITEVTKCP